MSDLHYCFGCGGANRIPAGRETEALCATCGDPVYFHGSAGLAARAPKPKPAFERRPRRFADLWAVLLLAAVAGGLAMTLPPDFFRQAGGEPATLVSAEEERQLDPVYVIPGVLRDGTERPATVRLRVLAPAGADHYLRMRAADGGEIALFARGGEPLDVLVPEGRFTVRHAGGRRWYGERYLFGAGTRFGAEAALDTTATRAATLRLGPAESREMPPAF